MIIHPPILESLETHLEISAQVQMEFPQPQSLRKLWFRFPRHLRDVLSPDSDPFAVALLLVAMEKNEPLHIRGSLSRKLYEGLNEYQKIYHSWFPERFHIIQILPESLRDDSVPAQTPGTVSQTHSVPTPTSPFVPQNDSVPSTPIAACAFSGGVDSFYTYLTLRNSTPNLCYTLFMAGFDMPLNLKTSIQELTRSYAEMFSPQPPKTDSVPTHPDSVPHPTFIAGSTNIRKFVNTVDWTNAHGQALVASALFFRKIWNQFYIPSSYMQGAYPKWGSHPSLDPLLSTETLQMIHHGDHLNRVRKLETIIQAPESYSRLRVCWIQDIGLRNCGKCEKCIRTQVALMILGALPKYTTFPNTVLPHKTLRSLYFRTYQGRLFARELIREAWRHGKYSISWDLGYALLRRKLARAVRTCRDFLS